MSYEKNVKKEIEKLLRTNEESFAPWELDEGGCDVRPEENMLKFGKEAYNLAIDNILKNAPITEVQKASILSMKI